MHILTRDSKKKVLYKVRDGKGCNYTKSGDISEVSQICDNNQRVAQ